VQLANASIFFFGKRGGIYQIDKHHEGRVNTKGHDVQHAGVMLVKKKLFR